MEKMPPINQMESAQLAIDGTARNLTGAAHTLATPSTTPAQVEHYGSPKFVPVPAPSSNKRMSTVNSQVSLERNSSSSVSNCYFFKSRLQEYAQKAGIPTPVYETIKEGPSHEPSFRSTVIVNNVRYDSLPGFFNRKAAEQSAAEVALIELANSVDMKFGISQPVHETGLCKNLLQEYAQKMNYAIPLYECHKDEKQGRKSMYSCVLEIGGIKYIGASASTKKEAEIKVARTALLAIQSAASVSEDHGGNSSYTVVPRKRKVADLGISTQETAAALKPKKGRFKKQQLKKKRARGKMSAGLAVNMNGQTGVKSGVTGAVGVEVSVTDVASQVEIAGGLVQVEASVPGVSSLVESTGGLVQVEASVTDVDSQVETAGGLVQVEASVTDVGTQVESTEVLVRVEASVTDVDSQVETTGGLVQVEAIVTDVGSLVESTGVLVQVEASVTDVDSQVDTAGGLVQVEASVIDVGSQVETTGGLVRVEASVTDGGSQVETAGGFVRVEASATDGGSQVEMTGDLGGLSVTNANSFLEPDSGVTAMEITSDICTKEFHNGNVENALTLLDEHFKDGGSTAMDMHP